MDCDTSTHENGKNTRTTQKHNIWFVINKKTIEKLVKYN